jgi:hypothetical protein
MEKVIPRLAGNAGVEKDGVFPEVDFSIEEIRGENY